MLARECCSDVSWLGTKRSSSVNKTSQRAQVVTLFLRKFSLGKSADRIVIKELANKYTLYVSKCRHWS